MMVMMMLLTAVDAVAAVTVVSSFTDLHLGLQNLLSENINNFKNCVCFLNDLA
ncbi:hypothetical protein Hanom_Chr16g01484531 [Helianthus anomalus]